MKSPVLALPRFAFRTTRRLAKLPLPVLAGAAALIYKKAHRSAPQPTARVMPDPGPAASPIKKASAPRVEPVAEPREPEMVVDGVPLAEAAVDLDVDVTLPSELPIRSYDAMNAADAARAIRELGAVEEVRTVLAFEEENSKRSTVLTAARSHLATLERSVRQ